MLSKLIEILGTGTDVRSVAAIVLGVLTTVIGHNSVIVKAVVDGVAGLIVLVDTFQLHKTKQTAVAAAASSATVRTTAVPQTTVTTQTTQAA